MQRDAFCSRQGAVYCCIACMVLTGIHRDCSIKCDANADRLSALGAQRNADVRGASANPHVMQNTHDLMRTMHWRSCNALISIRFRRQDLPNLDWHCEEDR
jgi:hypothetical protein